ncbi:hypothetical protein fugu_008449 [Takifugu bimaculatus]|uniref:Uncharacterized protein n=1 Tax=Takifugu bimaculatus TaxID=433685 RepID=A0A4Z2B3P0_9TELE|nr:hypothetical protein fugu_008449 [Takifugu bimaculatus]
MLRVTLLLGLLLSCALAHPMGQALKRFARSESSSDSNSGSDSNEQRGGSRPTGTPSQLSPQQVQQLMQLLINILQANNAAATTAAATTTACHHHGCHHHGCHHHGSHHCSCHNHRCHHCRSYNLNMKPVLYNRILLLFKCTILVHFSQILSFCAFRNTFCSLWLLTFGLSPHSSGLLWFYTIKKTCLTHDVFVLLMWDSDGSPLISSPSKVAEEDRLQFPNKWTRRCCIKEELGISRSKLQPPSATTTTTTTSLLKVLS